MKTAVGIVCAAALGLSVGIAVLVGLVQLIRTAFAPAYGYRERDRQFTARAVLIYAALALVVVGAAWGLS